MHHAFMTIKHEIPTAGLRCGQRLMVADGLSGALAAASCCILPLALFNLGVSGAWIGTLTQIASYQPLFIVATLACPGYGHWLVYCSSKAECAEGEQCARPLSNWFVRLGLNLTADDLKSTMSAYPTGASDTGYMM
jgi:mercuric ion transport protein